jgi:hypothetical protein
MITPEQLQEIESFAGLFIFNKTEILLIVGVSPDANSSEIDNTIKAGKLKSKAKVYQSILNLAYNGSAEAQKQVLRMIQENERKKL